MDAKQLATDIVKRLVREGYIAYFAGGWVRDYMMGHPSSDIDIATNAPPEKIIDLFPRTLLVGLSFGVVVVIIDGHQFEVSTFRRDMGYADGRRPEQIELSTPYEDAIRRDFTINGMFYDPLTDVVHDYIHGAEDIEKGLIRTIGNPYERFMEDRLRMIRAVRFAARFNFTIDPDTQEAIIANADALFPAVAKERVWQEFNKIAATHHFDHALIDMQRLGLLPVIFPQLQGLHLDDLRHRIAPFKQFPKQTPTILYLAQLFPDMKFDDLLDIGRNLKVSNRDLKLLELWHHLLQLSKGSPNPIEWAKFYADPHSQLCIDILASSFEGEKLDQFLTGHAAQRNKLAFHIDRLQKKQPLVTAHDLLKRGIVPGKNMGELLRLAEQFAVNEDLNQSDEVIIRLETLPIWPKKNE